jgi:type VI secretion system protein ImpM
MPDPRPLTGLYGKVPAHGDFVRRGLPSSFVSPWDAWLAAGIAAARERLGPHWEAAWDSAPAWRFALPPGMCGPDPVAGVMLPSQDQVGRRFPITLAALLAPGAAPPDVAWFDALEAAALAGQAGLADADALSAALPLPGAPILATAFALPLIAPRDPGADAPDEAWAPASAAPLEAEDVLALLGGAGPDASEASDRDALSFLLAKAPPREDDVLSGLIGGASAGADWRIATPHDSTPQGVAQGLAPWLPTAPPPVGPSPPEPDGTLAALLGEPKSGHDDAARAWDPATCQAPSPAALPAGGTDGTLPGLIGCAADVPAPAAPAPDPDGTLAGLIAVAGDPSAEAWAPAYAAMPSDDGTLSGLIGAAGPQPDPAAETWAAAGMPDDAPASLAGLPATDPEPPAAQGQDLLPGAASPGAAEPIDAAPVSAVAPPAPEGGGWWTRGGAHVPPMVWPLPGLPDPADFAYLLEAAA